MGHREWGMGHREWGMGHRLIEISKSIITGVLTEMILCVSLQGRYNYIKSFIKAERRKNVQ
ncbi:MAG: hypothetical protein KME33_02020 [Aetokthonos hydrillicola CCALA 1050]|nr:hypothetical protein [Aetokthonos hydrillicola CCALA 1050]